MASRTMSWGGRTVSAECNRGFKAGHVMKTLLLYNTEEKEVAITKPESLLYLIPLNSPSQRK